MASSSVTPVVRIATRSDLAALRKVRLAALLDAPEAFASSYERELARTEADWEHWLSPGATFLLDHDGDASGLVAVAPDVTGRRVAWLLSMWVAPAQRRSGAGGRLVAAALSWADHRRDRFDEVWLDVAPGNDAAQTLYERQGFVLTPHRRSDYDACDLAMARPVPSASAAPPDT